MKYATIATEGLSGGWVQHASHHTLCHPAGFPQHPFSPTSRVFPPLWPYLLQPAPNLPSSCRGSFQVSYNNPRTLCCLVFSVKVGGGNGVNREIAIDIYTLLCKKQVTNENLLCSTGNYSTLCGDLNGKEIPLKKEGIYVYVQLIHSAVLQKLTHCIKQLYYHKKKIVKQ